MRIVALGIALGMLVACDVGSGEPTDAAPHDAAVARHDVATAADAARATDVVAPDDGSAVLDASTPSDDGVVTPPLDASIATDAGRRRDAGGTPMDAAHGADAGDASHTGSDAGASIWVPAPTTSWQWQLSGTLDTSVDVAMYDIDLFDTSTATIDALHAAGRRVVCYFDLAYEPGRPDTSRFPAATIGNEMDGWPGEHWVDIRSSAVVDIMLARMDLAVSKHCDGIEPDDIDAVTNNPGFPFTAADQLAYARTLARGAHARGLSIALKNDLDQVAALVGDFDFAINEQCFQYNECGGLAPFVTAGKAVFQVEYGAASLATSVCPRANTMGFETLIKRLALDAWRVPCR